MTHKCSGGNCRVCRITTDDVYYSGEFLYPLIVNTGDTVTSILKKINQKIDTGISITTGNLVEGTGISFSGNSKNRIVGAGNLTINLDLESGNGISVVGNTITNTLPDQIVTITGIGSTTVTGSYPNFTISSEGIEYEAGSGIDITGNVISNTGVLTETDPTVPSWVKSITQTDIDNWNTSFGDGIVSGSFNTSTGNITLSKEGGSTVVFNLDGRYLLSTDVPDIEALEPLFYNNTTGELYISQAGSTTDGYLSSTDWNTFNNKADAFSTGNIVAGTGVTFTGSGTNRLFGSGNLTIEVEPVDLSGYVPSTRTITIQGQAKDLSQDREWSLTTTDIPEGINLYFTTSRARNSLSAGPGISYDPLTGIISNSAQGEEIELIEGANIIITGTAPSFTIAADLSNYYTKSELQTSGDSQVHWDNITDVPDFMENDLTVNAPLVYNPVLNHMHITAASATSDGFLTIADWVRFNNKADAFSTGNITAGSGITLSGTGLNRLFGVGDLTISATPPDLSGYVPTSRTLTINGTTYDLSDDRTWTIPVADGSETKINAGTGVTVTGSGTTGNPYVISSPYQTLSWNNTTKTISISNGNSQVLSGLVSSDVSITNSYGINIGGDLSTGLSIGLDTTVVDLRYLRKDVDDSNGANKLTLGELEAGDTEITGTLTLGSVASGPMTNNFLTIDPSTGEVEQTPLSVEIPDLVVADGSGVTQFEVDLASENLKFVGTGDTAVSFNAATNTITINSVPGQGGGGSVTSFNGRDGAVVSITGDYNTSQVTETTNLYFTEPRVLSTVLTGFTPTFGTVTSTDTVLSAFEKLQSQLDYKVGINTTLTVNGTAGRVIVSGGTQSLNANRVWTVDLANAGTAGTYTKVTTDAYGRVTSGTTLQTSDLPISAGSGIDISPTGVISNTAQDQAISITGTGLTTVTGTYPSFTVDTTLIAGPGIDITGNTISSTATTPNLQQVTDVGNTTTNNIIVGSSTNNTKISALNVDIGTYDPTSTWSRSHSVTRYASGEPTHLVSFGAYGPSSGINYGYISSKLATPYSAADIKFIDGKVGINLSSDTVPTYNLEVIGNARISSIGNAVGDFVTANSTGVLSRRTATQALSDMGGVSSSRNIVAGNGLTGGGTLASDVTLTIGTPGSITATSTNEVTATSHTHELAANAVTTAKILNSNVTFAKIQNIPTQTLIGRYSTGTGVAQSITLGTGLNLNASGVLSATNTSAGTVTSVSSTVGGTALSVAVTNPTTTPNLAFDWEGTTSQYVTGAGTLVTFPAIPQGTVTSITIGNGLTGSSPITSTGTITLGTPGAVTLSSTNSVTASSHTHAFTPGGTTSQYIRGDGTLATFPTLPTVNNGTLTLGTSGIATGSASFTANQSGNSSFTVNVPGTNLGSSLSGNNLTITSSTGTNTTVDLSGLASVTPNLQQVTDVNNVTDNALRVTGFTNPSGATTGMILSYDATSQTSAIKHNGTTVFQSENSSVGVIAPDNPITGIIATGDVVQLLANGTTTFGLVGTSGNELAIFNTRVQGLDAVNSNEFVTLSQLPDVSGFVPNTRSIIAGNGLTGGGTLAADRTLTLGTPGSITSSSTNSVTATSHTHELAANAVTTAKIANGAVTNAKINDVAWSKVTGAPSFLTTETDPVYSASIPDQMMFKGLIPGGSDLNTYTTTGIYHQNSNANASSGTNYPVPYSGVLEVKHLGATFFYQTYTSYNGGSSSSYNNVFVRTYYNGNWSSWRRLLQNNDIPSTPTLQQVTTAGNTSSNDIYFNITSGKLTKYGSSGVTVTDVVTYENPSNDNFTARIKGFNTWSSNYGSGWHFTTHNATPSGAAGEITALTLFPSGNARFPSLSGSGNRMVIANSSGDLSTQAIPTQPTNYVTTNTNQTGLTGDKTTTGAWHFRLLNNSYYNDQDNNPRFYVGNAASGGTNGFIFRMGASTHRFQIRSVSNDQLFHVYNDGTITAYGLSGTGTRMVVANASGDLSTQAIPTYTGSTSITVSGGTISRPALTGDVTAPANSNTTTIANNAVTTAKIANNAVTLAKLEDLDQYEFIGRYSSGTGDPQKLKLGSGFDVDTSTGVVDVSGGGGGWVDEMGYDYEGNADNLSKGLDTRGGYATRPFVFINNSTIPDDVETCIFIGDKATLTIPDPALYENRVISIINRGGDFLDLAGYLPIINASLSTTINELATSSYLGPVFGNWANSLEIQSIYNPITSTYIWIVLHFHFSGLE